MASSSSSPAAGDATLVHVAFKNDPTHFVASTASGFHVFSCDSLKRVFGRCSVSPDGANVTFAELLTPAVTPLVAVAKRKPDAVDGTTHEDTISFWNGMRIPAMTNSVRSSCGAVRGMRMLGDYMLAAGQETAMLYVLGRREKEVKTGPNPLGLCALAQPLGRTTLVYALPGPEKGEVQVRRSDRADSVHVRAHGSGVACLALSHDGRLLATAGCRGTLVRIFSTSHGTMLRELRRGSDGADIHCIVFSPDSKWLAVSSDKATVHVFTVNIDVSSLTPEDGYDPDVVLPAASVPSPAPPAKGNQGSSSLSFIKGYLPWYSSSQRSLAQFRLREGTKYSVAFGQDPNTVLIVGMDGSFHRCLFDSVNGGEMMLLQAENFWRISNDEAAIKSQQIF